MTAKATATPTELIEHAQISTDAWGGLAIATGAAMKPEKCFTYFMIYTHPNECPTMGNIGNLPTPLTYIPQLVGPPLPSHMTVLLPNGTAFPIPTLPPTVASLILQIWFGPAS